MRIKDLKDVEKKQSNLKINSFQKGNSMTILSMGENMQRIQSKEAKNLSHKVSLKLMEELLTLIQAMKMITLEEKAKQDKNKQDMQLMMLYQKEILLEIALIKMLTQLKRAKEEKSISHRIIFKVEVNLKVALPTLMIIMEVMVNKQVIEILEVDLYSTVYFYPILFL